MMTLKLKTNLRVDKNIKGFVHKLRIRELTEADLLNVAQIHILAFPKSALTSLGLKAVSRYYEWQLSGPHDCVAIGIFCKDTFLGFCFGGIFTGALTGFLRNNKCYLAARLISRPWLITNSLIRKRLLFGSRLLRRKKTLISPKHESKPSKKSFGILAIAVHPKHQHFGVGVSLMSHVESIASQKGYRMMNLTVQPTNQKAVRFYDGLGW